MAPREFPANDKFNENVGLAETHPSHGAHSNRAGNLVLDADTDRAASASCFRGW
jgi:hypothetical protein